MALTTEQSKSLTDLLSRVELGQGVGTEDRPCSVAAINIALSGELTDTPPGCMSLVIGKWIIAVQDLMPDGTRNCRQWKDLLPLAAGTGRDREKEEARFNLLADWMWERVLPRVSTDKWPADMREAWGKTLKERSPECVETLILMYLEGASIDVNLKSLRKVALVQSQLPFHSFLLKLNTIANTATYTTYCIDADWEEGVWDDADGLDLIGTLERLIEV